MNSIRTHALRLLLIVGCAFTLSGCGGGGGGDDTPPPSGGDVTISGRISFDRPPFNTELETGLNMASPVEMPARDVVVEIIDAGSSAVLGSTTTNASGDYSVAVPANRSAFVRAKAQMLRNSGTPNWNFRVLNNTNSDALYALDGSAFNTGTAASTRNLRAATGWGTNSYTGTRAAAPFAILDTVYRAKELILTADPNAAFANLDFFWSPDNRATVNRFCPDTGDIGTTFYQVSGTSDECATPAELPAGIYVLGSFDSGSGDTDEFDQHVIAHEFGHYFEDRFSRSDSLGGSHNGTDRLDLRVAFGEGWGNAFAGMSVQDPQYRDSMSGVDFDFGLNLESDDPRAEGWFSELSVGEIIWDIYDSVAEPHDTIALGFTPIFQTMTGPQVTTDALTSIFSFATGMRQTSSADAAAINALLTAENIATTDEFATAEGNDGGNADVLPIYRPSPDGMQVPVCVSATSTSGTSDNNKLGNRKFFRFVNQSARLVTITARGAVNQEVPNSVAATDPDIFLFRRGAIVAAGITDGDSTETLDQIAVAAGTHIIEVYDFDLQFNASTTRCMTLSITGN